MAIDSVQIRADGPARRICIAAAALAAGVLLLLLVAGTAQAAPRTLVGDIGRVAGEVVVLRGTERLTASPGTAVFEGDAVATSASSKVEILCADGSSIVVGPQTTVSLGVYAADDDGAGRALLDLIEGILRVTLSGGTSWSSFEVRSATAIASVRSTDWIVDAAPAKTGVFVVDGSVVVTGRQVDEAVTLQPGQGTDVAPFAAPTAPKAWGQPRVDDVLARTTLP